MPDRDPHPRAHTHGDDYEKDILDRLLTEVEGLRDETLAELKGLRADFAAAFPKVDASLSLKPEPDVPVEVAITEPAAPVSARKRSARTAPVSKENTYGND